MKNIIKLFTDIVGKLLKKELGSTAGKVNLIGGVAVIAMAVLVFVENIGVKVLNAFLAFFDKPLLPAVGTNHILGFFVIILIYFYLCVRVIMEVDR